MGRHSAPDNDDDDGVIAAGDTVVVVPSAGATRPRPGRHAHAADAGQDEGDENTAQITPIVDPVLDEPLPAAMTTVIAPVRDDEPVTEGGLVDDLLADPDADTPPPDEPLVAPSAKKGKAPKPPKAEKPPKRPKTPKPPKPPKAAKRPEASTTATPPAVVPVEAAAVEQAARELPSPTGPAASPSEPPVDFSSAPPSEPDARDQLFGSILPVEPAVEDLPFASVEPTEATKRDRPEPHVSDRTLLARDTAARARVIAAVVVPFVLYVVVLLVLDELVLRTALIWIWLPLITAGVVAGLILDLAHRAAAARAITALEERVSDR